MSTSQRAEATRKPAPAGGPAVMWRGKRFRLPTPAAMPLEAPPCASPPQSSRSSSVSTEGSATSATPADRANQRPLSPRHQRPERISRGRQQTTEKQSSYHTPVLTGQTDPQCTMTPPQHQHHTLEVVSR